MKALYLVFVALMMVFSSSFLSGDASSQNQVTLRDYVDVLINERTRQLEIRMESAEKAVKLAREELQLELLKLNNLRQEVTKDRSLLIDKDVHQADIKALNKDIQGLKEGFGNLEARFTTWISAIGIFFVVVQILINYFNRKSLRKEPI